MWGTLVLSLAGGVLFLIELEDCAAAGAADFPYL